MKAADRVIIALARTIRRRRRRELAVPQEVVGEAARRFPVPDRPPGAVASRGRSGAPVRSPVAGALAAVVVAAAIGGYHHGSEVARSYYLDELRGQQALAEGRIREANDRFLAQDVCLARAELTVAQRTGKRAAATIFNSGEVKACQAQREAEVDRITEEIERLRGEKKGGN
jgi:hypothetical protein